MSVRAIGWAFDQGGLTPRDKLVLVALADNANDEGVCWPGWESVARKTGLSRASVYRSYTALGKADLLVETTDSKGREIKELRLTVRRPVSERDDQSHSETPYIEEPSNEPSKKQTHVNRKKISKDERSLAAAVVQLFNSSAGTSLSVDAHLTPIVGRIREHPQLEAQHHGKIIQVFFEGEHWWDGAPTPRLIYGNAGQFERALETARAAMKKKARSDSDPNAERERVRQEFKEAEEEDADN